MMKHVPSDGFPYYIEVLGNTSFQEAFASSAHFEILEQLSEVDAMFKYAPEKWSIKQVLGHITDHERIMMYRILRFSRNDTTVLPGYDEQLMMQHSRFEDLSFAFLLEDFKCVRAASLSFMASLSEEQLGIMGVASGYSFSIADFLKSTIGHEWHHFNIFKERYFPLM